MHLSTRFCSGHITREEALEELKNPIYPKDELVSEKQEVLKKLQLTENELDEFLKLPPVLHEFYCTDWLWRFLSKIQYLQYFIGHERYRYEEPFDVSMMVHFRKRLNLNELSGINEQIHSKQRKQKKLPGGQRQA